MKVKIIATYVGAISGVTVPGIGQEIDLDKDDAVWLIENNFAEPVKKEVKSKASKPQAKETKNIKIKKRFDCKSFRIFEK